MIKHCKKMWNVYTLKQCNLKGIIPNYVCRLPMPSGIFDHICY